MYSLCILCVRMFANNFPTLLSSSCLCTRFALCLLIEYQLRSFLLFIPYQNMNIVFRRRHESFAVNSILSLLYSITAWPTRIFASGIVIIVSKADLIRCQKYILRQLTSPHSRVTFNLLQCYTVAVFLPINVDAVTITIMRSEIVIDRLYEGYAEWAWMNGKTTRALEEKKKNVFFRFHIPFLRAKLLLLLLRYYKFDTWGDVRS